MPKLNEKTAQLVNKVYNKIFLAEVREEFHAVQNFHCWKKRTKNNKIKPFYVQYKYSYVNWKRFL